MAKTLNEISGMPQLDSVLDGWEIPISLVYRETQIVDAIPTLSETRVEFKGTVQPLDPETVKLKPEGQRSWEWLQIHTKSRSQNLSPNDIIIVNGTEYKVMGKKNYSLNGYVEYHAVNEYKEN